MMAVVQRASEARVLVDGDVVGEIGRGSLVLLGVRDGDRPDDARWLARKTAHLRIFPDDDANMNLALEDVDGSMLVVPQFTLYGDCRKGRRPSFVHAAPPGPAEELYELYCQTVREEGVPVQTGVFGAMMDVELVNDGPVTLIPTTEHRRDEGN